MNPTKVVNEISWSAVRNHWYVYVCGTHLTSLAHLICLMVPSSFLRRFIRKEFVYWLHLPGVYINFQHLLRLFIWPSLASFIKCLPYVALLITSAHSAHLPGTHKLYFFGYTLLLPTLLPLHGTHFPYIPGPDLPYIVLSLLAWRSPFLLTLHSFPSSTLFTWRTPTSHGDQFTCLILTLPDA